MAASSPGTVVSSVTSSAVLDGYFECNKPRAPRSNQGETPGDEAGAAMHSGKSAICAAVSPCKSVGSRREEHGKGGVLTPSLVPPILFKK